MDACESPDVAATLIGAPGAVAGGVIVAVFPAKFVGELIATTPAPNESKDKRLSESVPFVGNAE